MSERVFSKKDFDYTLPEELIAQVPVPHRSDSRLLVMDKQSQTIQHQQFTDIIDQLSPNDLLVLNNTRVIPARLHGHKASGGKIEALVERVVSEYRALVHIKSSRSPKHDSDLIFQKLGANGELLDAGCEAYQARVVSREGALFVCEFHSPVLDVLHAIGEMPLPPYIERPAEDEDQERYQTVFAKHEGAVAAPTASLHFTDDIFQALADKGVQITEITLHVGAGTFQPVKVDNIDEHVMHSEVVDVPDTAVAMIKKTKERGGRVIAVGTTVVRSLESAVIDGEVKSLKGETDIFIKPGYQFQVIDGLLTNFHLPESTLIMLVSAFAGYDLTMHAYQAAVQERYRFFSYGDAMLIL